MEILWQDIALSIGSVVGLSSKVYALLDSDTVWSRWASIPNAILFVPSIAAFASLGLWITALNATLAMLLWFGIGIWRAPDDD